MTAEDKYKAQLEELGIWRDAFAPEVHTLCMMERELRRAQKAMKDKTEDENADRYKVVLQLRRDILAHRDALGLTPKALRRLIGESAATEAGGTFEIGFTNGDGTDGESG